MLYIDQYYPKSLETVSFNQIAAYNLLACAHVINAPHIILRGASGSGKRTMANLYLHAKYPKFEVNQIRQQILEIKHVSKILEIKLLYSDYHYHLDPSMYGVYDRFIVQGFIKDLLQTRPICRIPYHIIIIENADRLTIEAQQSLRRTLEKNISNCRFIFLVNQEATLIEALMSRCLQIRLASPTVEHIMGVLKHIVNDQKLDSIDEQLSQIAQYSQRNLTKAINTLQLLQVTMPELLKQKQMIEFNKILIVDRRIWEIIDELFAEIRPKAIQYFDSDTKTNTGIRFLLYNLLMHCLDPLDLLKQMYQISLTRLSQLQLGEEIKHQLIDILVKYENTLKLGSKPVYHLEGFLIALMGLLNQNQNQNQNQKLKIKKNNMKN